MPTQHDLAGLEALMNLLLPLEEIFVALYEHEHAHKSQLRDREQFALRMAVENMALLLDALQNRLS